MNDDINAINTSNLEIFQLLKENKKLTRGQLRMIHESKETQDKKHHQ